MIVLDTSVWVGILVISDFHYLASRAWYGRWIGAGGHIQIPSLCLVEIAGTLGRQRQARPAVSATMDALMNSPEVGLHPLDIPLAQLSAEIALAAGLRGADAVFVALAVALGLPLVSWDQEQLPMGSALCRTMTPVAAMEMSA